MSDVLSTTNPPRNRFTSTLGESLVYDKEEARELFV
ncbi:BnaCnng31810D [Brassica napus]|uniref:BnaCnng31810D protein n=2 Tax=Brassica TaxID=3705 RepID=A0A078J4B9_BRANA|nr:BnaCnng31810D [Brassica napus]